MPWREFFTWVAQGVIVGALLFVGAAAVVAVRDVIKKKGND